MDLLDAPYTSSQLTEAELPERQELPIPKASQCPSCSPSQAKVIVSEEGCGQTLLSCTTGTTNPVCTKEETTHVEHSLSNTTLEQAPDSWDLNRLMLLSGSHGPIVGMNLHASKLLCQLHKSSTLVS